MFIILEGCDKTGKSSLSKHLQNFTGWEIVKFSQPKREAYIEYQEFLVNRKKPAIIDRFYLGEHVYGLLWRGKSDLNEWQNRMLEMTLLARNTLTIYCETDEKTIKENFIKEKEEFAKAEQISDILLHFKIAIAKSSLKWILFDYKKDFKYDTINYTVQEWLGAYIQNKLLIEKLIDSRAIGNPFSKNVIVGDVCNGDLELEKYKDIIMPFAKGVSSDYLWKAIDDIPKNDYLMTNAKKYHQTRKLDISDIFYAYPQNIICLGNNAYNDVVSELKGSMNFYKITKVKHPAWGTRFGIDPKEYGKTIKKSLV